MSAQAAARHALRVLVVDDEALARGRLKTLLHDCRAPTALVAGEAADAVQAMTQLQHQSVDVVLLDIHMPGSDGLVLARQLRSMAQAPALIFVTAHAEHALHAFELDATDYLTKPVRLERLQAALQKVERIRQARLDAPPTSLPEDAIVIQDRHGTERLPLRDVLYFKAELKYITVRTAARHYLWDGSLGELEEKHGGRFIRIHRNALVSREAARALQKHHDPEEGEGWALRLDGVHEVLLVSRRQLAAVREMLSRG